LRHDNDFVRRYHDKNKKKVYFTIIFAVVSVIGIWVAISVGLYNISLEYTYQVIFEHLTGHITDTKADNYIFNIRLPRALAAVLMGAVLAIGGAIMQNATNNPLAEPYTLGISSAALLGATLAMAWNLYLIPGLDTEYSIVGNAFVFALIPVAVILLISQFRKMSSVGIILIGIALMYLFSSVSQYIMVTSTAETLSDIYNWRVGSLHRMEKSYEDLAFVSAIVIPISILLICMNRKLDLMYAGDRNAKTMGLDVRSFRIIIMTLVSLCTAAIVCFTGTIGFIGLVGPHVARAFVGSSNKYLLPCSAAFGAAFLVFADTIAKVSGPGGLPVGVISSIVGGPLFLYILIRHNRKVWN
jgi:ABC-type Fe3+-siderophore transport system permease subunit